MDFFSVLFANILRPPVSTNSKIIEYSTEAAMENGPFSCEISVVYKEDE